MKNTFILYKDLGKKLNKLSREDKGCLLDMILAYENGDDFPEDITLAAEIAFEFVKAQLDEFDSMYEETVQKRKDAANARWHKDNAKDANACTCMQSNANDALTLTHTLTLNKEKDSKESKKKAVAFTPPTVDEVKKYCDERNNGINPIQFVDYYQANGWMRGKTKIKDWKACVRTWEQRDRAAPVPISIKKDKQGIQRNSDLDSWLTRQVIGGIK